MKEERCRQIREAIDDNGEITLLELQHMFPGCSTMTLRRDLIALEDEGTIKRTRGGAIALRRMAETEGLYSQRAAENMNGKMEIARTCVHLLEHNTALYLDSGTTVMCLAKQLPKGYRSVITSGVNTALELIKHTSFSVTLLGGQLDGNTLGLSGQVAEMVVDTFNIETAIMSTSGFHLENGFSNTSHSENELKQAIIRKANRVILLMDSSKMGRIMPLTFATLSDIDVLVSDCSPTEELMALCEETGVEFIRAGMPIAKKA